MFDNIWLVEKFRLNEKFRLFLIFVHVTKFENFILATSDFPGQGDF